MSRRRSPGAAAAAASLLRGSAGSALLCLARAMSLCRAAATCAAGPSGGGSPSARFSPPWLRLPEVPGADPCRTNDVLLLLPPPPGEPPPPPRHHVVYFPGDVQNYHDVMACHPENFQWACWSLENIAIILARRFPNSYVWVVKCSRMHLHKFSCYDNFVASNMFGAPDHSIDFGAFTHLHALLVNAFSVTQNILLSQKSMHSFNKDATIAVCESKSVPTRNGCPSAKTERNCEHSSNFAINFGAPSVIGAASFTLIGFSKGCVVLNQLLYELKETKKDRNTDAFIKNIKAFYWLDGGHSGGSNTWVTDPEVLKEFAQTGIAVHTHVTPYQVFDTMRSWIGKEHRKFVQILEEFGVHVNKVLHFADEIPSLDNHFRVHEVF